MLLFNCFFLTICYIICEGRFLLSSARLYAFLFFISVFCSLLINTRLVFIWYFVSVPLRKVIGVWSNSVRLFVCTCFVLHFWLFVLRLFAFLIICIETFGFLEIFVQQIHFNDFLVRASVTKSRCNNFLENLMCPCKDLIWTKHRVEWISIFCYHIQQIVTS